jgi:hypothetical protein
MHSVQFVIDTTSAHSHTICKRCYKLSLDVSFPTCFGEYWLSSGRPLHKDIDKSINLNADPSGRAV